MSPSFEGEGVRRSENWREVPNLGRGIMLHGAGLPAQGAGNMASIRAAASFAEYMRVNRGAGPTSGALHGALLIALCPQTRP